MNQYQSTNLKHFGDVSVGQFKEEPYGTKGRTRLLTCKAIHLNTLSDAYYGLWQYVSKRTRKPTGSSSAYLELIK